MDGSLPKKKKKKTNNPDFLSYVCLARESALLRVTNEMESALWGGGR